MVIDIDSTQLISLDIYNKLIWRLNSLESNSGNGIACPKCGEELIDSKPGWIKMTNPGQTNIHCNNCQYSGTRYVL